MQPELFRTELQRLVRQRPFRPFVLTLVGGERAVIEHPENIAFDPRPGGTTDFYALTRSLRLFSTFEAVSSAMMLSGSKNGQKEQAQGTP
jgi:hypothetical protein